MLRKCAYWVNRLLWTVLVTALVLVAAYVSMGRYYTALVEQYQQDLINRFANYTGLPLTAQRLYGRWSHLSPIITMENLVLHSPSSSGDAVLSIDTISFQLDPLSSLLNASLQVKQLSVAGVLCELEEIKPGKWQLKGYPTQQDGETDFDKAIDLVLSVDSVELSALTFQMFYHQGNTALLESKELSLRRDDDFRRLRLQATFNKAANPLFAVIEAIGDPRDTNDFSAQAYIKLDDVDFTDQLPLIRSLGLDLHKAEVDSEVWVDWKPKNIISIQGQAAIPQIDWLTIVNQFTGSDSTPSMQESPPLENVQLNFRAERSSSNDWQLWLPSVQAQWRQQTLDIQKLYLGINADAIEVALPTLSLEELTEQVVALDVLSEKAQSKLQILSPTGNLNNIHVKIALQNGSVADNNQQSSEPRFLVMGNLEQVGVNAWRGAPGAKGINGFIEAAPAYGMVEFNSEQLSLDFPVVYRHWLDFDQARGQVRWDINGDRVRVKSGPMHLQADFGPATGLLTLDLPMFKGSDDPRMTLAIGMRDASAHHRNKLIPYTLNKNFLNWMARSVPEGHIIDGGFIYRGSLLKKARGDRTVQLYFNVDNTTLDYHQDWPPLRNISGMVLIDNAVVDVTTRQANMFGLSIDNAHVQVAPKHTGGMWLSVDATATGDGSDALKVVTQSKIHDIVGSTFDNWVLRGAAKANVKLGIPLAGAKEQTDIDVNVSLNGNQLQIPDFRVNFTDLTGPLNFSSDKGLVSSGLNGQLYGKPINVTVQSAQDKSVLVDINGRIDMSDVAAWSRQPAMTFVKGETDFNAKVDIKGKGSEEGPGQFSVSSMLEGVVIDLPEPFHKAADSSRAFWLTVPLKSDTTLLNMGMKDLVQLQLQLKKGDFHSALVTIETDAANDAPLKTMAHERGVFIVTGDGPKVQLDQLHAVLEQYLAAAQQFDSDKPVTSDEVAIRVKNLSLASVSGFGKTFDKTVVNAERRDDMWWLAMTNNFLSGEVKIPDDKQRPYIVDLQRLHFPEGTSKDENGGLSSIDPKNFADVNLSVADVAFGDEHYGSIAFNLRSDANGARFENLTGNIRGAHIRTKSPGLLLWNNVDGVAQSHLSVRLDVGDVGKVLDNWNYERVIESKTGIIDVNLHWRARPDQWQLKSSEGTVQIKLKDGRFFRASDTASGTLKVVGIVNLANIARRLKLDFKDFYESGISFDRIGGRLQLADGQLAIVDDITIKSPSSGFRLRGDADLDKEMLDMEMIVTLPVANNLPWIAAIAGGLPTAAGVFVASKLFEEQFDRLSSATYSVKGDWDNPELRFRRVFDQSKKNKNKKKGDAEKNSVELILDKPRS